MASIKDIITTTASKYGIDPNAFAKMAHIESRGNPNADNGTAQGLFQFVPSTAKDYGLANPFDAEANADAAARLWIDNKTALAKGLGREPTAGEIYLAHQQGSAGALNLLRNPDRPATQIVGPKAVRGNGGDSSMTAGQFAGMWTNRFDGTTPRLSEQAIASGGYQDGSTQDYQQVAPASTPDWLVASAPANSEENAPPPSWTQIGNAVWHSMPTQNSGQWLGNAQFQPDNDWLNNSDITKFGSTVQGLNDDEKDWLVGHAMNAEHAADLRRQIDQQHEDSLTLANSNIAFAGMLAAQVIDPVSLVAGGVASKSVIGLSNMLRATTSAGVITRMVEAGAIGSADASVASAIQSQVDPNFGAEDFAFNALTGMALGGALGTLGRSAHLDEAAAEATAMFGRRAREFVATKAEERGYGFKTPEARDSFVNGPRSAGAAENLASLSEKFPDYRTGLEKVGDRLGRTMSNEDLLFNRTGPEVAGITGELMPRMSGTGGRQLREEVSAFEEMRHATEVDHANMQKAVDLHFEKYLEETGQKTLNPLTRDALRDDFYQKISIEISHPTADAGSALSKAADEFRKGFGQKLKEAKEAGLKWAQDIPQDDHYFPMMYQKRAYYDVVSRIGRDGLVNVVRQAIERAQPDLYKFGKGKIVEVAGERGEVSKTQVKGKALPKAERDAKLNKLADTILKTIEETNVDNSTVGRIAAVGGDSARALRDLLAEHGLADEEIDNIVGQFDKDGKEGPGMFRRRTIMERDEPFVPEKFQGREDALDHAVSLRDLTDRNALDVWNRYSRSLNGYIALAKKGYKSEADVRNKIAEATTFRKIAEKVDGKQNVFEEDMKTAANELNYFVDRILGKPAFPNVSKKTRLALSILKNVGFVRFMQQSGIAQFGDAPKILLRYGLAATWKQSRMRDFLDVFTHTETEANALTREIQAATGVGIKTKNGRMYALHEDINLGGELFEDDAMTKMLAKVNSTTETAARLTASVSLLNPITDMLQLWAARSASQRMVDVALGKATMSQKWLNEMGLGSRELAAIKTVAGHMKLDENGNIVRWNSAGQKDADAYSLFLGLVRREAHTAILETAPIAIKRSMSHPVMGLFFQLKTYMFNSLLANTAKNIKLGPGYMAQSLIATSAWSSAVYAAQQYALSVGMAPEERRKFLEDRVSLKGVMAAGFQRSPDSSILPMIIDTAISTYDTFGSGKDHRLFTNTRTSGLGSSITDSIPALRMVNDLQTMAKNVGAAITRTDQKFDQTEAKEIRDFIPLMRTYAILNATNAFISTLPPDTDGALVKKQ